MSQVQKYCEHFVYFYYYLYNTKLSHCGSDVFKIFNRLYSILTNSKAQLVFLQLNLNKIISRDHIYRVKVRE